MNPNKLTFLNKVWHLFLFFMILIILHSNISLAAAPCIGDIDCSGSVDGKDVALLAAGFGQQGCGTQGARMIGEIVMWHGTVNVDGHPIIDVETGEIDSRWRACDGENGTPDLRGRFVKGAVDNTDLGDQGGNPQVVISTENLPTHDHSVDIVTTTDGEHSHSMFPVSWPLLFWNRTDVAGLGGETVVEDLSYIGNIYARIDPNGDHTHQATGMTDVTGGGQPINIQPPYYKLIYLVFTEE